MAIFVVRKRKQAEQPEIAAPKTGEARLPVTRAPEPDGLEESGGPDTANVDDVDGKTMGDKTAQDDEIIATGSDGNINMFSDTMDKEDNADTGSDANNSTFLLPGF